MYTIFKTLKQREYFIQNMIQQGLPLNNVVY